MLQSSLIIEMFYVHDGSVVCLSSDIAEIREWFGFELVSLVIKKGLRRMDMLNIKMMLIALSIVQW